MAIISSIKLPSIITGDTFEATLLPKVGSRDGMKCAYKLLIEGNSKKEGIYSLPNGVDINGDVHQYFNIGGCVVSLNSKGKTDVLPHRNSPKLFKIKDDPAFIEALKRTAVLFGHAPPEILDKGWTPPPPVDMTISEIEQEAIDSFGVF